jgi:hypothetical protein
MPRMLPWKSIRKGFVLYTKKRTSCCRNILSGERGGWVLSGRSSCEASNLSTISSAPPLLPIRLRERQGLSMTHEKRNRSCALNDKTNIFLCHYYMSYTTKHLNWDVPGAL